MTKKQTNIRMSEATRKKLDKLTKLYGTQAEVIAVAIDRLFCDADTDKQLSTRERAEALIERAILT